MHHNVNSKINYFIRPSDKQKIILLLPIFFFAITIGCISSCKDSVVQPKYKETRNPIILSLSVFPTYVKPSDSLIVICNAMDPDADTLVYDWYLSSTAVRIKDGFPGIAARYNTHDNYQVLYAPDSLYNTEPLKAFRIECAVRDGKGGQVSEQVKFYVIINGGEDSMNTK